MSEFFIKGLEKKSKRKRNTELFEKSEDYSLIRQTIYEMHCDYEFPIEYNDNEIISKHYNIPTYARISLYFNKLNNNVCKEYTTGYCFYRTDADTFYNDQTGLFFSFDSGLEKAVGYECVLDGEFKQEYREMVGEYFAYYTKLKKEDENKRSKALNLMLRNNMNLKRRENNDRI